MPYSIRKRKCKQSDGDAGSYVLSYTSKKGKKVNNCHTSKKKAQGQIAAIEGPRETDEPRGEQLKEAGRKITITKSGLRRMIREELGKAAPFGSGMEQAKLDPEQKELIGHTWLTHAKLRSSALQESLGVKGNAVGKVVWHSLEHNGKIAQYDIKFRHKTLRGVPSNLVEAAKVQEHKHEARKRR